MDFCPRGLPVERHFEQAQPQNFARILSGLSALDFQSILVKPNEYILNEMNKLATGGCAQVNAHFKSLKVF